MKLKSLILSVSLLFSLSQCLEPSIKKDQVIDHSPGPKPAWATGQKKKDTPQTEYYVGHGIAKSKANARNQAIRDVAVQISRRVMVEVYSIESSDQLNKRLLRRSTKITSKSILFDLKIRQEYFEQKERANRKTYFEYYIYTAYPSKSLSSTRKQIVQFLKGQAKKALKAYEAAMRQLRRGRVSEAVQNLADSKNLVTSLSFHKFALRSRRYPKIKNNFILSGYVNIAINKVQSHLFIRKLHDKQTGRQGEALKPFIIQAYYYKKKKRIPISGVQITFYQRNRQLSPFKITNSRGYAESPVITGGRSHGHYSLKARASYRVKGIRFEISPQSLTFTYSLVAALDIGMIILEERINKKGKSKIIAKTDLSTKLQRILSSKRLSSQQQHIQGRREKILFYKAVSGNNTALLYFKSKTGAKSLMLCHLKTQFSSKAHKRFIFYRTTINIKLVKGKGFETTYTESVQRVKGGGISSEKAIYSSINEALDLIIPKVKNSLALKA